MESLQPPSSIAEGTDPTLTSEGAKDADANGVGVVIWGVSAHRCPSTTLIRIAVLTHQEAEVQAKRSQNAG